MLKSRSIAERKARASKNSSQRCAATAAVIPAPTTSLITIVHAVPHIHHTRRDFHKLDKIGRALQHLTYTIASHPTSPSQPKRKRLCLAYSVSCPCSHTSTSLSR